MSNATSEQLREFQEQGFVQLRGFLSGEALQDLQKHLAEFIRETVPSLPREHVFYEDRDDPATLKQIQNLAEHDAYFQPLVDGALKEIAAQLLETTVRPVNLQYFNKPPGIGKATPPHQDGYYFMLKPCEAVTMWLALDDVDESNGCVRYVTGSHRDGMRPHHRTNTLGFSQGIEDYGSEEDLRREVATTAAPGDLLVHDALTIHRAEGNRSADRPRRALGAVYYSERAEQDEEAHRKYQEKLRADMMERGRI